MISQEDRVLAVLAKQLGGLGLDSTRKERVVAAMLALAAEVREDAAKVCMALQEDDVASRDPYDAGWDRALSTAAAAIRAQGGDQ